MASRIRAGVVLGMLGMMIPLASEARAQSADFLFRRPTVSAALRLGWAVPRAGSDLFDLVTDSLTLDRSDFATATIQAELGVRVGERLDLTLGVGHAESSSRSEFVNWVEEGDLPIEQTTTFRRTPIEVGVKGYLRERGRAISRFAWVPYRWAPYVGGGAGVMVYAFEQSGDFVDYETAEIFTRDFVSEGAAPTAHVAAGLDVSLSPHLLLTGEGRYQWASAELSDDFDAFDPIDLSGFQLTAGVAFRF